MMYEDWYARLPSSLLSQAQRHRLQTRAESYPQVGILTGKVRQTSPVVMSGLCSIISVLPYKLLRSALGLSTAAPCSLEV